MKSIASSTGFFNPLLYLSFFWNTHVISISLPVASSSCRDRTKRHLQWKKATIQQRILLPLANEAFSCFDLGICSRITDVDVVWVNGYGFPKFQGGPVFYALQTLGKEKTLELMREWDQELPPKINNEEPVKSYWRYHPHPLLVRNTLSRL